MRLVNNNVAICCLVQLNTFIKGQHFQQVMDADRQAHMPETRLSGLPPEQIGILQQHSKVSRREHLTDLEIPLGNIRLSRVTEASYCPRTQTRNICRTKSCHLSELEPIRDLLIADPIPQLPPLPLWCPVQRWRGEQQLARQLTERHSGEILPQTINKHLNLLSCLRQNQHLVPTQQLQQKAHTH